MKQDFCFLQNDCEEAENENYENDKNGGDYHTVSSALAMCTFKE